MDLIDIRIRNFRSIEAEQQISLGNSTTLVGPNNSGKTNILRAIQMLFTGYDNFYQYSIESDRTFGVGRVRTSISATFEAPATDKEIFSDLDELYKLQSQPRKGNRLSLSLYFTETNTPVYGIFPNVKRPSDPSENAQFSRIHKNLVKKLISRFQIYYVPSAKSIPEIYRELVVPVLRRQVARAIDPHVASVEDVLKKAAAALNDELSDAGLNTFRVQFDLPGQSTEKLISNFDFMISDPTLTSIGDKGMGIQTTALLAALRWITKAEDRLGKTVIWLMEEPESYLHPDLAIKCNRLIDQLSRDAIVVKTTHSMAFVPQDPLRVFGVYLNEDDRTEIERYDSYSEATQSIRAALGIQFSDFFNLSQYNIFVEGKTDRIIYQWVLEQIQSEFDDDRFTFLLKSKFEDWGGIPHLVGFLRASYPFIRNERALITIFDGDEAGDRARRELQGFFGQKEIPFESNLHFISLRTGFALEGLFPDSWIKAIHEEHPSWFEDFSVDVEQKLQSFSVHDKNKSQLLKALIGRASDQDDLSWAERFVTVFDTLESALRWQAKRIYGTDVP